MAKACSLGSAHGLIKVVLWKHLSPLAVLRSLRHCEFSLPPLLENSAGMWRLSVGERPFSRLPPMPLRREVGNWEPLSRPSTGGHHASRARVVGNIEKRTLQMKPNALNQSSVASKSYFHDDVASAIFTPLQVQTSCSDRGGLGCHTPRLVDIAR